MTEDVRADLARVALVDEGELPPRQNGVRNKFKSRSVHAALFKRITDEEPSRSGQRPK